MISAILKLALSPIGLKIIGGLALVLVVLGLIWSHDAKVRKTEAAKWRPKIEQCERDRELAAAANSSLRKDFDGFITKRDAEVKALNKQTADALKRRDAALEALGLRAAKDQTEIDRLRELAAAPPQPTPEVSCANALDILRGVAVDVVRNAAVDK